MVRQGIRFRILLARDVLDAEVPEGSDVLPGQRIQLSQHGMFDLVTPLELTHQKLRVRVYLDVRVSQYLSPLQREEKGAVLGDVIRRLADPAMKPFRDRAFWSDDDNTDAGRAWVAAGGAIDMDVNPPASLLRFAACGRGRFQGFQCGAYGLEGFRCREASG